MVEGGGAPRRRQERRAALWRLFFETLLALSVHPWSDGAQDQLPDTMAFRASFAAVGKKRFNAVFALARTGQVPPLVAGWQPAAWIMKSPGGSARFVRGRR